MDQEKWINVKERLYFDAQQQKKSDALILVDRPHEGPLELINHTKNDDTFF